MGRGRRTDSMCSGNTRARVKNMDYEDSDEDYVVEVDDQSEELDSLVGDASEEESLFEVVAERKGEKEQEEEENGEEDDENDDDDDDDDDEWRTVVKPRARKVNVSSRTKKVKGSTRNRKANGSKTRKRPTKPRKTGARSPKKRRIVRSDDDDEDSDDDDEEFTPDEEYMEEEEEEYLEEEEEFSLLKKNTKKRGRTKIKESTSVKSHKKSRAKVARKPCTKKRKKTSSLRRRTRSAEDEDFIEKGPTLRDRSRKQLAQRKNRVTGGSDSDFCSDSSDYEFTISEEEREQVREANQFCGSLATNLRSSRRIQEDEDFCELKPTPVRNVRKGKEKAEEKKNDVGKAVCGICLTEEGKNTTRGTLNCCSHYFCFACIFEWSKVETRCPLCKQRFVSISKPARCVRESELRDTVIAVPERDQVYQPSEEELRDFLNPYENVICTECHQGGDDALMLLCDLCDSPAHTYCVGLGHEVPEGNWYCDGCRPAALVFSNSQTQDPTLDLRISTGMSDGTSYENMAEIDLNVSIPETPVSQENGIFPSPRFSSGNFQAPSPASGMGVSTVSGRRMIHEQIRRHILSNRSSQISPGADISSLGNLAGHGINATQQLNRLTDIWSTHQAQYVDRLQENPSHSVQNRDSFPGRLGNMMRGLGQPSTSANGFAHSQEQWSESDRLNLADGQSQVTVSEHLRSCTSRSNIGPEIGVSTYDQRYGEQVNFLKQQVHIAVRSQLKSLSRHMNLGHNEYVEIARRSAYTIMAAYGLEPLRHDTHAAQPSTCIHLVANIEMSPMNGCCLVCFEGFVKDVVNRMVDIVVQPHWFGFRH